MASRGSCHICGLGPGLTSTHRGDNLGELSHLGRGIRGSVNRLPVGKAPWRGGIACRPTCLARFVAPGWADPSKDFGVCCPGASLVNNN